MIPEPAERIEEERLCVSGGVMTAVGKHVTCLVSTERGKVQECEENEGSIAEALIKCQETSKIFAVYCVTF